MASRAKLELPSRLASETLSPNIRAVVEAIGEELQEIEDALGEVAAAWLLKNAVGPRLAALAARVGQEMISEDEILMRTLIAMRDRINQSQGLPIDFLEVLDFLGLDWGARFDDPGLVMFEGLPHAELATETIVDVLKDAAHIGVGTLATIRTDDDRETSAPLVFASGRMDAERVFQGFALRGQLAGWSTSISPCRRAFLIAISSDGFTYSGPEPTVIFSSTLTASSRSVKAYQIDNPTGSEILAYVGVGPVDIVIIQCREALELTAEIISEFESSASVGTCSTLYTSRAYTAARITIMRASSDLEEVSLAKTGIGKTTPREFWTNSASFGASVNEASPWADWADSWSWDGAGGVEGLSLALALDSSQYGLLGGFGHWGQDRVTAAYGLTGRGGLAAHAVPHGSPAAAQSAWLSEIDSPTGFWTAKRAESLNIDGGAITRIQDAIGGNDLLPGPSAPRVRLWMGGMRSAEFDGIDDYMRALGAGDPYSGTEPMAFVLAAHALVVPAAYDASFFSFANSAAAAPGNFPAWQGATIRDTSLRAAFSRSENDDSFASAITYSPDIEDLPLIISGKCASGLLEIWVETPFESRYSSSAFAESAATIPHLSIGALFRESAQRFANIRFGALIVGRGFLDRAAAVAHMKKEFPLAL